MTPSVKDLDQRNFSFPFFLTSVPFASLDRSGEAGAVKKGHGTTRPPDQARNPHKSVLR